MNWKSLFPSRILSRGREYYLDGMRMPVCSGWEGLQAYGCGYKNGNEIRRRDGSKLFGFGIDGK